MIINVSSVEVTEVFQIGHYIRRSQGGLGIEENVVTLCPECHHDFDNGDKRKEYGEIIKNYLQGEYGSNWSEEKLIYKKY